jgi:glycosyltransferase involved in cell wall biosynthesis
MSLTDNSLVSIIIPCYNQAKYILECLDSVKAQTYSNWECIVIDDGSTDDTKILVQNYCLTENRIKYFFQQNSGVSTARNNAIKMSSGKYILPLDGDDKIGDCYIEKAVNLLENNEQLKVVYCKVDLFGNSSGKWNLPNYSFELLLNRNVFFCTALFRKTDFEKTNGYDPLMKVGLEDWDFWISLLSNGGEVFQINETLFFYRIVKNSRNSSFDENKEREIRQYVYLKHKSLYDKYVNISDLIYDTYLLTVKQESLINSWDYKIGKKILSIYRFLRSIIFKNK